jgi:hypothetical protein
MKSYSNDNIVFSNDDTLQQEATKTVHLYSGTHKLKSEMKRLKIEYVKVNKGAFITYVLRHKTFGKLIVKL